MKVDLPPELEDLVETKVKSGNYGSAGEVIREALGLLEERDQMLVLQKEEIKGKIAAGLKSLERGGGYRRRKGFRPDRSRTR